MGYENLRSPDKMLKVKTTRFIKGNAFIFEQMLLQFIAMFMLERNAAFAIYYSMPGQVLFGRR